MAGPTMMFATLNMTKPDGTAFNKSDTDELAAMWKEVIYSGCSETHVCSFVCGSAFTSPEWRCPAMI